MQVMTHWFARSEKVLGFSSRVDAALLYHIHGINIALSAAPDIGYHEMPSSVGREFRP